MHSLIRGSIRRTVSRPSRNLAGGSTSSASAELGSIGTTSTGLYDLWLNSMLPAVGPVVTSSSSHQINSERLAEKLMELSSNESARGIVEMRT